MMPEDAFSPQIMVQSVSFQGGVLNIQYAEARETNDFVSIARSLLVDLEQVETEVQELDELLRDIIDKALLILRNPPKKIRVPRRSDRDDELDEDDGNNSDS